MEKSYKEYLKEITTFIFDVDGVLTDSTIQIDYSGVILKTTYHKDGFAIKTAVAKGYNVCFFSGGKNPGIKQQLRALGVTDIYFSSEDKTEQLDEFLDLYKIEPGNVLYMGDDLPDSYAMQKVGLPCCPQDAAAEIKEISKYVSHKKGGKGCIRDVIEQVLKVQGKWIN
ncbi:MAG TPA: HAD hydrolase family protein [Salinimicrobium sp.]|nr:HAD hydrolase family protein [Salinimicrobium sp.]